MKSSEILIKLPEKTFWEILSDKNKQVLDRSQLQPSIWNEIVLNLQWYIDKMKYLDNKFLELKELLLSNPDVELSEIDGENILQIIKDYNTFIGCIWNFDVISGALDSILNWSWYINFVRNINPYLNPWNNWINLNQYLSTKIENAIINFRQINNDNSSRVINLSLKESIGIADKIKKIDLIKLENADEIATNLLEKKDLNIAWNLGNVSEYFINESNAHKVENKIKNITAWWAILWAILAIIAVANIYYFINHWDKLLSIWDSLLRLSIVTILSYLMIFSFKQYTQHKNLSLIYKFKALAINTMVWLRDISTETEKNLILEKSLWEIFSEPNIFQSKGDDKDVINIVTDSLKNFKTHS